MERYLRFPGGKGKALTFSYDDGTTSDIRLIEILQANGMKGTFNLNSGLMGEVGKDTRISAEEAPYIYTENVCEVACHALTHPALSDDNPIHVWNQVLQIVSTLRRFSTGRSTGWHIPMVPMEIT